MSNDLLRDVLLGVLSGAVWDAVKAIFKRPRK
jgi:hypothetical protein